MTKHLGKISKFIYKNENGFGVAIFILFNNEKKSLTLTGLISLMKVGIIYEISGEEIDDLKRNQKSFEVKSFVQVKKFDRNGFINYLSSPLFPTIGKKLAENIVDHYQDDVFKKILKSKDGLMKIKDMTKTKADIIYDIIKSRFSENKILEMFVKNDLKMEFLHLLQNTFEDLNLVNEILEKDFYHFAFQNNLKPFSEVDKISLAFGMDENDDKRISWHAHEITQELLFKTGNTYIILFDLLSKLKSQFNLDGDDLIKKLVYGKKEKILYFKNDDSKKVYTNESYEDEYFIAEKLLDFSNKSKYIKNDLDFEKHLQDIEISIAANKQIDNFKFNTEQILAIKNFLKNDVSIITGGPGTGKTTVINGIVKIYEKIYSDSTYAIAAPTGRAAGKIKDDSGYNATTIHRLLQYSGNNKFEANSSKPIYKKLVIIDECSMIDNHLFASLLRGIEGIQKILLVGDVEQLPSVSYGNLFEDLIQSNQFDTTILEKNNRQKSLKDKTNSIIDLATAIKNETVIDFNFENRDNLEFISDSDTEILNNKIKSKYLEFNLGDTNERLNEIQIIAPMYKGELGIDNINRQIQNLVNPTNSKVYKRFDDEFRINDKVMYLENDPILELSNGDVGYIKELNFFGDKFKSAQIIFNERELEITSTLFKNIKLNYACSIHKTQGSEYKNVLIVLDDKNGYSKRFLNKKMLYTAVTRAKENLIIFSSSDLFVGASHKLAETRYTSLKQMLLESNKKNN